MESDLNDSTLKVNEINVETFKGVGVASVKSVKNDMQIK